MKPTEHYIKDLDLRAEELWKTIRKCDMDLHLLAERRQGLFLLYEQLIATLRDAEEVWDQEGEE
jgi:hypothetical protein